MPFLDRQSFIELLERLKSEDDADVVAAARDIVFRMDEAGIRWEDVLAPEPDEDTFEEDELEEDELEDDEFEEDELDEDELDEDELEEDADDKEADEDLDEESDARPVVPDSGTLTEDAKLIDHMLAKYKLSEETRDELLGYKEDIAEDEFTESDSAYLRSLKKRLDGR